MEILVITAILSLVFLLITIVLGLILLSGRSKIIYHKILAGITMLILIAHIILLIIR